MDRYAKFLGPSRGVQRRSNRLDLQPGRSYSFGQKTQEVIRRRSGAETQQHIAADILDGSLRDRLLLFVKLFAGLGGTHDCKHILEAVRRSSEKPGRRDEQIQTQRRFRVRRLRRSELPTGTLQLARFL